MKIDKENDVALYNKYRPDTIAKIKGNKEIVKSLLSKIETNKIPQSILLQGPRGCGKTTIARILSSCLKCAEIDYTEMNCANDTGIDPVRGINKQMKYLPIDGTAKVFILDEAHRLTANAQAALLKSLEEPPKHVWFFLCTTDPQKLLTTVKSRCMILSVEPLSEKTLIILLQSICKKENKKVPRNIIEQIAQDSLGHPRDALVILETIIDLDENDMESVAKQTAIKQNAVIDLCRCLVKKRPWKEITSIINNLKEDPENIRRAVLGYCDSILGKTDDPSSYLIMDCFKATFFYTGKPGLRIACYEALQEIKGK